MKSWIRLWDKLCITLIIVMFNKLVQQVMFNKLASKIPNNKLVESPDNRDTASPTEADSGPYTPPPFCNRPPRRLLGCRPSSAAEERFYWNRESRSCDAFGFRGCDVGDNMFTSRFSCLATCAPDEG